MVRLKDWQADHVIVMHVFLCAQAKSLQRGLACTYCLFPSSSCMALSFAEESCLGEAVDVQEAVVLCHVRMPFFPLISLVEKRSMQGWESVLEGDTGMAGLLRFFEILKGFWDTLLKVFEVGNTLKMGQGGSCFFG